MQKEIEQIEEAVGWGFPKIKLEPLRDDCLSVVGFGPSLIDTWQDIKHPLITTSGAHDFLIERGVIPDYHAQCDGRDHQVKFLEAPQKDTTYLMASICPPAIWPILKGHDVRLWHNAHGNHVVRWIGSNDPGGILVAGGSNIGLSAIHLGGIMGFRRFKAYGFDGCYRDFKRHAGIHHDPMKQTIVRRWVGDRKWFTSPQMSNACDEFLNLLDTAGIEIEVFGDCLLKDLVDLHTTNRTTRLLAANQAGA